MIEAEKGRKNGTLTDKDIDNFAATISPMLNQAQREKLKSIVKKLIITFTSSLPIKKIMIGVMIMTAKMIPRQNLNSIDSQEMSNGCSKKILF